MTVILAVDFLLAQTIHLRGVARVLGRTQGVMRMTLLRIRQALRRCLEGRLALSER